MIDNETKTILIGDSHAQFGLNDKIIPNSLNMSYRSEKFIWSYLKLQKFLNLNKHIKHVVLSVSYHSFAKGNDIEILGSERSFFYARYGFLYNVEDYKNLFAEKYFNKDLFLNFLKYQVGVPIEGHKEIRMVLIDKLWHRNKRPEFWGAYKDISENDLSVKRLQKTANRHFSKKGRSNLQTIYFKKIIKLALDRGVKLTLVTLPVHTDYLFKIPPEQKRYYESSIMMAKKWGVNSINLSRLKIQKSYFKDYDHLNQKGAAFIAKNYLKEI